ncbi:MAG: hypothetical protein ABSA08_00960 [Acidimicrobiales bacterium]|jgi:hypothetical protein
MSAIDNDPRVLVVSGPRSACGGSFQLSQASSLTCVEALSAGWSAELVEGSQQIVVRASAAIDSYAAVLGRAYEAAQEALDRFTMHAMTDLVIESADSGHIAWWTDAGSLVTRLFGVSDMGMKGSATGYWTEKDGNVVSHPPPSLVWHPSLRYFRLAQITSDLFDAYRNMYLGLEALLSSIVPQLLSAAGVPTEKEGVWLKRALQQVDSALPLSRYAPTGSHDAVTDVFNDLYVGTRSALFHSKFGRPVLLPHSAITETPVNDALERLSRLFLDLFHMQFGYIRHSSGMSTAAFDLATSWNAECVVSDDPAPTSKTDLAINPSGGAVGRLATTPAPDLSEPDLKFWFGEQPTVDLRSTLTAIHRVGLESAGNLIQVCRLDDPLSLDGIDDLQVQQGVRLVNPQLPRFRFLT